MTQRPPGQPALSRRGLLASTAGVSALALGGLTGCTLGTVPQRARVARSSYGADASQFGDLYLPDGTPRATLVVLHGGYWQDGFGLDPMAPMCRALQGDGYAVWNLEYRRLDGGGGWPVTFTDVAAGIDHLLTFDTVDTAEVTLVGHSAGGQLAVWAASRTDESPGGPSAVTVRGTVSLAGVLDLIAASEQRLGSGNVDRLMGGSPQEVPDHYRVGDPTLMVPAAGPVHCLHGLDDTVVPRDQSTSYVAAAARVGADVTFADVPGDHSTIIDPTSDDWAAVTALLPG